MIMLPSFDMVTADCVEFVVDVELSAFSLTFDAFFPFGILQSVNNGVA